MKANITKFLNAFLTLLCMVGLVSMIEAQELKIGWATVDITPDQPVLIAGQFQARVSQGVMDPVTANVLVMESVTAGGNEKAIMVSCDLVLINDMNSNSPDMNSEDDLLTSVRKTVTSRLPELKAWDIFLNATHTHAAPYCSTIDDIEERYGVGLDAMSPYEYLTFAAEKISNAVIEAWLDRAPGGISYGLAHATVGRNRLQASFNGESIMYGNTDRNDFSHMEGYEDHSLNLLYTWDSEKNLTGVVINIACPSQVSGGADSLSADFWNEVRVDLRNALKDDVFILPQCSAAGDQSPHLLYDQKGESRMQELKYPGVKSGRTSMGRRKQIGEEITNAVLSILSVMEQNIEFNPFLKHDTEIIELTRRYLNEDDVADSKFRGNEWTAKYQELRADLEANPELMEKPKWFRDITYAYSRARWYNGVENRFELEKTQPKLPVEVHVVRLGDIVFVSNPFELYLDYGIRMKARSPATQTFIIQLAGSGSYLPTKRSIKGGAYGAVPSSTLIGPIGGQELVEESLKMIHQMW